VGGRAVSGQPFPVSAFIGVRIGDEVGQLQPSWERNEW